MKLKASTGGSEREIELDLSPDRVAAEIEGRHYDIEVLAAEGESYLLSWNNEIFDCRVFGPVASGRPVAVVVGPNQHSVTITDPKRLRSAQRASAHGQGSAQIVAAMPGKVIRVLVEVGAQVGSGTGIVVVEAMKMQNEMKSPKPGTVTAIRAQPGATVNAGDVLAVIE